MKVVLVIPFAYERFFPDSKQVFEFPELFEDTVISQRETWHTNWIKSMLNAGIEVKVYHISKYAKINRTYSHRIGFEIKRFPVSFLHAFTKEEFSFPLINELNNDKPDVVFCITHLLLSTVDMVDLISFQCSIKKIPFVVRNPGADSYSYIYNRYLKYQNLISKNKNWRIKKIKLYFKLFYFHITASIKFRIKKHTFSRLGLFISQTDIDYINLLEKFNLNSNKISLFPKPVDLSLYYDLPKAIAAEFLGLDINNKYLLHISNLYDTKGCEHIIYSLPDLLNKYPEIKLLIVGGGPKRKILKNIVEEKSLDNHVLFLGQRSSKELLYLYNIADIFVLPTEREYNEGQPNVIIEAIACNLPVISTNLPGPSAVVKKEFGYLIEPGDRLDLTSKIISIFNERFTINQNSREEFIKNYSISNVGDKLKQKFETLIIK